MKRAWLLLSAFTVFAMAVCFQSGAATYYVATNGAGDGSTWALATNNIQDAISLATTADDIVLVSNGVYDVGGVTNSLETLGTTNRVSITNAYITVRSANNDPTNTIIKGNIAAPSTTAIRCVYMNNNTTLIGFTLTNGSTKATGTGGGVMSQSTNTVISNCIMIGCKSAGYNGAGAYGGTLYNCTITNNSCQSFAGGVQAATLYNCSIANNFAANCGGVRNSTLYNCLLKNNYSTDATASGGGALNSTLYNCLIVNNTSATYGGGVSGGVIYNCTVISNTAAIVGGGVSTAGVYNSIIYFNSASSGSNCTDLIAGTNSCTTPAISGVGNITDNPMFADFGTGNWRLGPISPCINTGTNFLWTLDPADVRSKDLDGKIRIRYGTVDMGAYERIHEGSIYCVR